MQTNGYRIYARCLQGTLGLSVFAYALAAVWIDPDLLAGRVASGPAGPLLTLAALATTVLALRGGLRHPPRFALTFVLAAMVVLPAPGALLVALPALVLGRGGAVVGPFSKGLPWFAAAGVATALAQFVVATWRDPAAPDSLTGLAAVAAGFVILQALSWALSFAIGEDADLGADVRVALLVETLNVPLAWLLATQILGGHTGAAFVTGALAIGFGEAISRWQATRAELQDNRHALDSRLGELSTLNAIGRELLSTLELGPLFTTIDRECRKAFDSDLCQIALRDPESGELRSVYRRLRGGDPDTREIALHVGLNCRVAERRRGLFVRDLRLMPGIVRDHTESDLRSAMAVPLRVGQRVIGVLTVGSNHPDAYDEHRLSVLDTVAQQAAVAVENARHFRMATIDGLTGFFTRARFFDRFEDEHRRVERYGGDFAVLMIDLDGFKQINDRHGHLAGDQYLRAIADTVRDQLRDADLPCRYGGDEFCVLLPSTSLEGARAIGERIRSAVAARFVRDGSAVLRATVSVGVAAFPVEEAGASGMLRHADEALYRAKRAGRNRVVA